LNVPVVLKFAPPDLAQKDPLRSRAFEREASILAHLREKKKENVTKLTHDLATAEYVVQDPNFGARITFRYFGLALYPETLLDLINAKARSFHEMMAVFRCVVQGMNQIHAEGICHRDLKPSNCLVDGSEAFLGDFGCARRAEDERMSADERYKWLVWGDQRYVAPEAFLGVDHMVLLRADFYSLGCILFEMCTGMILAEQIRPAIDRLQRANVLLARDPGKRTDNLVDGIVRDLEVGGYLPRIGLQAPVPGPSTRDQLQRLYERLCSFDPRKRLTDFDEVFRRTDGIIDVAREEHQRRARRP
jgi:serine/threonine protein kinase